MLQLNHLSKYYMQESGQQLAAVEDACLDIGNEHHLISLIGPDGAGKSTLLKLIAGLIEADKGEVNTQQPLTIGYMSQHLGLYEDLSVIENLRLFAKLRDITPPSTKSLWQQILSLLKGKQTEYSQKQGEDNLSLDFPYQHTTVAAVATNAANTRHSSIPSGDTDKGTDKSAIADNGAAKSNLAENGAARETKEGSQAQANGVAHTPQTAEELDSYLMNLLTKVGLAKFKDYKAGSLSGGMKQKLALTCAISARPQLLILDEPTVGVDPISRRELWQIIYDYLEQSSSYCIFSSLYLEEAEKSSLTIFMQHGKIIYAGASQELKNQVSQQCFALNLYHHSYQKLARGLICAKAQHPESCIIDVCPRLGRIDLLTKAGTTLPQLETELESLLKTIPEFSQAKGVFTNTLDSQEAVALATNAATTNSTTKDSSNTPDYTLNQREPILEDAYINLTFKPNQLNQGNVAADSLGTDGIKPSAGTITLDTHTTSNQSAAAGFSSDSDSNSTLVTGTDSVEDSDSKASKDSQDKQDQDAAMPKTSEDTATVTKASEGSGTTNKSEDSAHSQGKEVVIKVNKIKKQFGDFTAVHDSSFNVYKGEIFGLLGPNGAGKTTTFRMICALLNPSAGTILINGLSLQHAKSSVRATIGYVAQKFCLYRKMTLLQNLLYFGTSYGLNGEYLEERIKFLCETFGLTPFKDEFAGNLPFGIQRSLSMACALIHKPAILFLDEATSGADPTSRRTLWTLISQLAAAGTTIIVTTHFMEEAEYCDRFLIQDQGKILILGTPDEICLKPQEQEGQEGQEEQYGQKAAPKQGPSAEPQVRISIEEAFIRCVEEQRQATGKP